MEREQKIEAKERVVGWQFSSEVAESKGERHSGEKGNVLDY
jgi:hypothetical protein